jgi:hypothetical protein
VIHELALARQNMKMEGSPFIRGLRRGVFEAEHAANAEFSEDCHGGMDCRHPGSLDASGNIHVNLGSSTPCWNDVIEGFC